MFWTRVASGIVLLIILGAVFTFGGAVLGIFTGLISLVGINEYYKAIGLLKNGKIADPITFIGYLGVIILYVVLLVTKGNAEAVLLVTVFVGIMMLTCFVFTFPKYNIKDITFAYFGYCYAPLMLSFMYMTRQLSEGKYIVWLIFFSSWICDIFAYCVGMLFGKHKLAPKLSPKKSIEGSVGGVVFSAIFAGVYGYFVKGYIATDFSVIPAFVVLCAVGAIVSQVGDLAASAIKRNYDIKDYGKLIPGHGGILDRFDSVIVISPMIYLVAVIFMAIG